MDQWVVDSPEHCVMTYLRQHKVEQRPELRQAVLKRCTRDQQPATDRATQPMMRIFSVEEVMMTTAVFIVDDWSDKQARCLKTLSRTLSLHIRACARVHAPVPRLVVLPQDLRELRVRILQAVACTGWKWRDAPKSMLMVSVAYKHAQAYHRR